MARKTVITWPLLDTAAVCALQTTAGAGAFLMNGTMVQAENPNSTNKIYKNWNLTRTVSLTSTGNISGVNFTITGTNFIGGVLTETIAGPNNNTVYTTNYFLSVTSVTVNAAVLTNTSVGTGTTGQTIFQRFNPHADVNNLTVAVKVTGTLSWTFQATLDNPLITPSPLMFNPSYTAIAQTASLVFSSGLDTLAYTGAGAPTYLAPVYAPITFDHYNILVNSSNNTGTFTVTTYQQGIT